MLQTLKETQNQLLQTEKLSSIGEFIAGITHELNNPLTAIIGFSEMLQLSDIDESVKYRITRIGECAERSRNIVHNLLSFSRQRAPARSAVNLNSLLDATLRFISYEFRTNDIEVRKTYDPDLPAVMADPYQIQQVFLNILNNARQAMANNEGERCIRVLTDRVESDSVRVRIEDNGSGIPENELDKIFDPFFTTKRPGPRNRVRVECFVWNHSRTWWEDYGKK